MTILVAGVWLFRQSNRHEPEGELLVETAEPSLSEMDVEALMDAIIVLDDHFKSGELLEEAYLQRRAVLKEQLRMKLG